MVRSILLIFYCSMLLAVVVAGQEKLLAKHRIVLSITSFGGRMNHLNDTIRSLILQTLKVDAIYIHIPLKVNRIKSTSQSERIKIESFIKSMTSQYGPILKFYMGEDFGPATKLLGTLLYEKDPKTLIITVDDDTEYHSSMVSSYYNGYLAHPSHFITTSCEVLDSVRGSGKWHKEKPNRICKGWGCAFAGILYKREMFDDSVFNMKNMPQGCFIHDDVYLSGYLYKRGLRPFALEIPFNTVLSHKTTNHSIHFSEDIRRKQVSCIKYFNQFK